MDEFLTASKAALNAWTSYDRIRVVMGNGTCDLDSAISALVRAFSYYRDDSSQEDGERAAPVVPVMNVAENEFRVKTEVVWFLRENGIDARSMTFRNQIDLESMAREKRLELTLVDHHALAREDLPLAESVVEIVDHRPGDPAWPWPGARFLLQPVGSCATLVAHEILMKNRKILDARICNLLRGPILVDTHNFGAEAARATPLDREVIRELETFLASPIVPRDEMYAKILAAKSDVSGLTPRDLLLKDCKVVDDAAIPGFPILVEKFMELPNALEEVVAFAREAPFALVILLGMDLEGERTRRDMGILVPSTIHEHEIVSRLRNSELGLVASRDERFPKDALDSGERYRFLLFRQENVRATRKHILPMVRSALRELPRSPRLASSPLE